MPVCKLSWGRSSSENEREEVQANRHEQNGKGYKGYAFYVTSSKNRRPFAKSGTTVSIIHFFRNLRTKILS